MTLKQLMGILLLLSIASTMAAAAGSQLTQIRVSSQGSVDTVTLRATGALTHTEYRPTNNLLLLDLADVSVAKMDSKTHLLRARNVVSYRVLGYKAASGKTVARIELALAPGAKVDIAEASNELRVQVEGADSGRATPVAQAASGATTTPQTVSTPAPARVAVIHRVGVVRRRTGVEVEITANAALTPKALKLSGPDRVVIDLPNAVAAQKTKTIAVHSDDIDTVRVGRYQLNPPMTRVVVDLKKNLDFDLQASGNRLFVKLHPTANTEAGPSSPPASVTKTADGAPIATAGPISKPEAQAVELAVIRPEFHTVTPKAEPAIKAASAAEKFGATKVDAAYNFATPASSTLNPLANKNLAFQQQAAPTAAPGATARPKYTGEPISVNLKDVDLKDFFRLIHEISGLNVVLDPNVHGTLTIVLDDVPWDQALDIVLKNNGLDRQLEGNVLRIATVETFRKEADARRAQVEAQALAVDKVTVTRFLSYAHSKDVATTIKKFLSVRGDIVSDDRTNSLIIDDIPNVIPKVDELLAKLDRKTQEVEIEARVVAATRNFARDIGMQLAFGFGNRVSATGGTTEVAPTGSPILTPPGQFIVIGDPTSGKPLPIPLFSNLPATGATSGISFTNFTGTYRLDAILTMAESRGLLKILSRPRIVTQNNILALVKQGVRLPIVTAAQLGGPPTVSYVDAFLRLTVTPQITIENTIFLNVDVENTVPDRANAVSGNPALLTQQATTQVLVTDGGTVVIGGVIQTNNAVNIVQVPLLGNIPIFGNLFKHRSVSTTTQELIFFITPRIIQT